MKRAILLFLAGGILLAASIILSGLIAYSSLPDVEALKGCLTTEMFKVNLCPKSENYVRLHDVSPHLRSAIIISEDASFYSHNGFDIDEIKESFEKNWENLRFARGASTITQQMVKNVFLTKDKTLVRKIKEAILTRRVEEKYSKDFIFEHYLNVVQFGKDLFGVKAAARYYFKKEPSQLSVLESAFLAMLLPNPEKYSASFHHQKLTRFARERIKDITRKLVSVGRISEEEFEQARAQMDLFPWNQMVEVGSPDDVNEPIDPLSEDDPVPTAIHASPNVKAPVDPLENDDSI